MLFILFSMIRTHRSAHTTQQYWKCEIIKLRQTHTKIDDVMTYIDGKILQSV